MQKLTADAAPVPAQVMVAQSADQVQEDATKTGFSEDCLHGDLLTGASRAE
jgi:hypothetical protein